MIRSSDKILVIDDNPAIHQDFEKILASTVEVSSFSDAELALFGDDLDSSQPEKTTFDLEHAYQGDEALQLVKKSVDQDSRFAFAFVDMRMPPGWNGVETIIRLREVDQDLQVVICSAFSDLTTEEILQELGGDQGVHFLNKPFYPQDAKDIAAEISQKAAG